MPRKKIVGNGYADKGRSFVGAADSAPEAYRDAREAWTRVTAEGAGRCGAALAGLAYYDDGWLRVVSHGFGANVYFKFKFSRGKFSGSYVFYRCDDLDFATALEVLLGKVEGVYAGSVRPTPDTPYD